MGYSGCCGDCMRRVYDQCAGGLYNGCLTGFFDEKLYYRDGKVYLESDIWFSSDVNVEVYESENIFFVRLVDEYNRPASDEFAR